MEETLNSILSELQHLNKIQQEFMIEQKELIGRIENLEEGQKKLITTSTKSSNKIHGELKIGQQQLGVRIENFERIKDFFSMGQIEIKELIKQSTAYMSGRLSGSERMMMEIDWFTDSERQELLNKINEKMFTRKGNRWSDNWEEHYDDY